MGADVHLVVQSTHWQCRQTSPTSQRLLVGLLPLGRLFAGARVGIWRTRLATAIVLCPAGRSHSSGPFSGNKRFSRVYLLDFTQIADLPCCATGQPYGVYLFRRPIVDTCGFMPSHSPTVAWFQVKLVGDDEETFVNKTSTVVYFTVTGRSSRSRAC